MLAEHDRLKAFRLKPPQIEERSARFIKDNAEVLGEVERYKFVDEDGVYTGSQSVHNPHPGGYDYEILQSGNQATDAETRKRLSFPLGNDETRLH